MASPPITVEQYLGFESPEGYHDELINGRIVVSPRPKPLHCDVAMNIFRLLRALLAGQPYGAHLSSNIQLGPHDMPSPDVFIVPNDVWRRACNMDEYLASPPLMVAEVVSCANTKENVEEKTVLYLSQGVPMIWIVYPSEKKIEVVTPTGRTALSEPPGPLAITLPEPLRGSISLPEIFNLEE